jgi:hypothetical protein
LAGFGSIWRNLDWIFLDIIRYVNVLSRGELQGYRLAEKDTQAIEKLESRAKVHGGAPKAG